MRSWLQCKRLTNSYIVPIDLRPRLWGWGLKLTALSLKMEVQRELWFGRTLDTIVGLLVLTLTGTGRTAVFTLMFVPLREFPIWRIKVDLYHTMVHQIEQTVQMSYQGAWSTFTLRTLVDMFSLRRLETVTPCSSANSSIDTMPNEETLCKSTHTTTARHTLSR